MVALSAVFLLQFFSFLPKISGVGPSDPSPRSTTVLKQKGLMSRTMAVHVRYNSRYISLPSSAKQLEMTKAMLHEAIFLQLAMQRLEIEDLSSRRGNVTRKQLVSPRGSFYFSCNSQRKYSCSCTRGCYT